MAENSGFGKYNFEGMVSNVGKLSQYFPIMTSCRSWDIPELWLQAVSLACHQRMALVHSLPRSDACTVFGDMSWPLCKCTWILAPEQILWCWWEFGRYVEKVLQWLERAKPTTTVSEFNLYFFSGQYSIPKLLTFHTVDLFKQQIHHSSQDQSELQGFHSSEHWFGKGFYVPRTWQCVQGCFHESFRLVLCHDCCRSRAEIPPWTSVKDVSSVRTCIKSKLDGLILCFGLDLNESQWPISWWTNTMKYILPFYVPLLLRLLQDETLGLIAVCLWNLHRAIWVMDHAGLVLLDEEAEVQRFSKSSFSKSRSTNPFLHLDKSYLWGVLSTKPWRKSTQAFKTIGSMWRTSVSRFSKNRSTNPFLHLHKSYFWVSFPQNPEGNPHKLSKPSHCLAACGAQVWSEGTKVVQTTAETPQQRPHGRTNAPHQTQPEEADVLFPGRVLFGLSKKDSCEVPRGIGSETGLPKIFGISSSPLARQ